MRNIFVLGFFPDQNKALLKTLCENFNIIMVKGQFASRFGDIKVQFIEDIVEVNQLQFPQTAFLNSSAVVTYFIAPFWNKTLQLFSLPSLNIYFTADSAG